MLVMINGGKNIAVSARANGGTKKLEISTIFQVSSG